MQAYELAVNPTRPTGQSKLLVYILGYVSSDNLGGNSTIYASGYAVVTENFISN